MSVDCWRIHGIPMPVGGSDSKGLDQPSRYQCKVTSWLNYTEFILLYLLISNFQISGDSKTQITRAVGLVLGVAARGRLHEVDGAHIIVYQQQKQAMPSGH